MNSPLFIFLLVADAFLLGYEWRGLALRRRDAAAKAGKTGGRGHE